MTGEIALARAVEKNEHALAGQPAHIRRHAVSPRPAANRRPRHGVENVRQRRRVEIVDHVFRNDRHLTGVIEGLDRVAGRVDRNLVEIAGGHIRLRRPDGRNRGQRGRPCSPEERRLEKGALAPQPPHCVLSFHHDPQTPDKSNCE